MLRQRHERLLTLRLNTKASVVVAQIQCLELPSKEASMNTYSHASLQSILKRRQRQDFVGRQEEVKFFCQNLTLSPEDNRRRFVFNIFGQGGVGKTSLLRRLFKLAEEAPF